MRTGAEYREALRDGRRVWVMGEGLVDDVTTHPATRAMVDEYVAWYDLHFDPAWQDIALRRGRPRRPGPMWRRGSADDLIGMGRFFSASTFFSAGNITHTPCYGHLIALGLLCSVQERNVSAEQIANAVALSRDDRQHRAVSDVLRRRARRSASACARTRPTAPRCRSYARPMPGIVIHGKIGMHTSPAYAEDVYVGSISGLEIGEHRATFIVPVNAPGVTTVCRKIAVRDSKPVRGAAQQPLRRTRRPDVARRRVHPVGARLSARPVAGAGRPLADLASSLRLAVEGGVHARPGAGPDPCDGARAARRRRSSTWSI